MKVNVNTKVYCNDDLIVCHNVHHGVGYSIEGIRFSCTFSFQSRKSVKRECRMEYLKILYDNMTKQGDDAHNDLED
jgi:hypothetical protein